MWKNIENTDYFVHLSTQDGLVVYITDFINIWMVRYTEKQFLEDLKETNAHLEMPDVNFLSKGKEMLSIPENYYRCPNFQALDDKLLVSLVKMFPFKFKLVLELKRGSRELFFQKVTQLLLNTISDLKSSQIELRQLIYKKDKHIAEYKDEFGEIPHYYMEAKFNEDDHLKKHNTYEENFGQTNLPDSLLKKTVAVIENEVASVAIKNEPVSQTVDIKMEPASQSQDSTIVDSTRIKTEEIKTESKTWVSPKKKIKLNL